MAEQPDQNKEEVEEGSRSCSSGSGAMLASQTGKMLTRLTRLGSVVPQVLSKAPTRFVSQSKAAGAAGSSVVTELHPAAPSSGHGEVSEYVKVSFCSLSGNV